MSKVQRSFSIAVIDDGSQLSWNLISNGTISQTWFNGVPIPDFETTQPTLYLALRNGSRYVTPSSTFTWSYNGVALSFDANNYNVAGDNIQAGVFLKTVVNMGTQASPINMPALRIMKNLATASNTDVDTISFAGSYLIENGGSIPIQDSYLVTITEAKDGNAHQGVLTTTSKVLTEEIQSATITATLYNPDGTMSQDSFVTWWSINDGSTWNGNTTHTLTVNASQVDDMINVICEFWPVGTSTSTHPSTGAPLWTAILEIDDITDEYQLTFKSVQAHISDIASANSFGTGDHANLRKDEAVKIQCYASKTNDPSTVITGIFNYAYVLAYDFKNSPFSGSLTGFNSPTSGNWRPISSLSSGIATQIARYENASALGGSGSFTFMMTTTQLT